MELINKLYQNEHKHKVGVDGWTAEQHLAHRKKYALDTLGEIKDVLDEIEERGDLLPKSELREAITYLRNEWNAVVDIFNYGDTYSCQEKTHCSSAAIRVPNGAPYSTR